jgi:uncharacterized protein CbrC (UPF0167 family)
MTTVERCTISCQSCNHRWVLSGTLSDYERIALETRPCPHCNAYTLASDDAEQTVARAKKAKPHWLTTLRRQRARQPKPLA